MANVKLCRMPPGCLIQINFVLLSPFDYRSACSTHGV
jgi:hypothetical protein